MERSPEARTLFNALHAFKTFFRSDKASMLKKTLAAENRTEAINVRIGRGRTGPHSIGSVGDFRAKSAVSVGNRTDTVYQLTDPRSSSCHGHKQHRQFYPCPRTVSGYRTNSDGNRVLTRWSRQSMPALAQWRQWMVEDI